MKRRKEEGQIPAYCITVTPVDYGPDLGRFDFFNDKKPVPREELARGVYLNQFVEEVIKGKFLKT